MTSVRPATPADVPVIVELIKALAEYEKLPVDPALNESALARHLFGPKPLAETLIAEADGVAAGFALFFSTYSTFRAKPGLYLEDLFVKPEFRGRGLGKALLVELARTAVARDCGRVEWAVLDWNTPSIEFYQRLGAEPVEGWTTYRWHGDALAKAGAVPPAGRPGYSLLELIVVLAIIAVCLGLVFPAVQSSRRRATQLQCLNHVRQLNLGVMDFYEAEKKLPGPGKPGTLGGWSIAVLPYLEQKNLYSQAVAGTPLANAPEAFRKPPRIFRCPVRTKTEPEAVGMVEYASYLLVPRDGRKSYFLSDAPTGVDRAWAEGPEATPDVFAAGRGPHAGRYCVAGGLHDAAVMSDGFSRR